MNNSADDTTALLRERLDQLADSMTGGDDIDGAELYRRAVKRRRRRIAATAGLAVASVVLAGAAVGSVVRPEASPEIGPGPASRAGSGGCVIPDRFAEDVEMGVLSEERACEYAQARERERAIQEGLVTPDYSFPEGPSLVVEGQVQDDTVADCRAGTYDSGDGFADLYCNALLKIAAGELKPTGTCGPPDCPEEGTPVWAYGEPQLRELAQ